MTHPRTLMYAEVREEVVLASEVATLLEELIAEHRFLTEHQCGEQFITCSVSVSCSYENTIILDPLMETVVPKTLTGEVAVAIPSDSKCIGWRILPTRPATSLKPSKSAVSGMRITT